jgi:hypothetical protein
MQFSEYSRVDHLYAEEGFRFDEKVCKKQADDGGQAFRHLTEVDPWPVLTVRLIGYL